MKNVKLLVVKRTIEVLESEIKEVIVLNNNHEIIITENKNGEVFITRRDLKYRNFGFNKVVDSYSKALEVAEWFAYEYLVEEKRKSGRRDRKALIELKYDNSKEKIALHKPDKPEYLNNSCQSLVV